MARPQRDPAKAAAVLEDYEFLRSAGVGIDEAARRLGYSSRNSLDVVLKRARLEAADHDQDQQDQQHDDQDRDEVGAEIHAS